METILKNMDLCYGCNACVNKCPKSAITMQPDECGFLYPVIDTKKCVDCKLCQKTCPAASTYYGNSDTPEAYALAASEDVLYNSSSGGVFTLLAEEVLRSGGYVAGASYDENLVVRHELIFSLEDLDRIRRSKYVQSDTRMTFKETEVLIKSGKPVLYVGTPCQIAGLLKFLGKNYDNLLTVDLICHGVPSPQYLANYLDKHHDVSQIADVEFRTRDGWGVGLNVVMKDGTNINLPNMQSSYMKGFLKDITLRKSCYTCKYTCLPRKGDLTIGDLWSASKMKLDVPHQKGISVILANNAKGKAFLERATENSVHTYQMQKLSSLKGLNANIFKTSLHNTCDVFNENYKNMDFDKAVNMTLYKHDVGLMLYMSNNYGSIATNYALYSTIKGLGKTALVLDNLRPLAGEAAAFGKKYMKLSSTFLPRGDYRNANMLCDSFVVGSDMSWNWELYSVRSQLEYLLLGFTDDTKRRIAYAPSMGAEKKTMEESQLALYRQYLGRFHGLSVREDYAVGMCKDLFDLDAKQVLDPVFVCDRKYYYDLVKESKIDTSEEYILGYILTPTPGKRQVLLETAKRLGKKLVVLLDIDPNNKNVKQRMNMDDYVVEASFVDWLAYFANASCIITDSFHGCCFSLIFEKTFVGIKNRSKQRFDSLANLIGVQSIFYEDARPLMGNDHFFEQLDYTAINQRLAERRADNLTWLKDKLETKVSGVPAESYEFGLEYAKLLRSRNAHQAVAVKYRADEIRAAKLAEQAKKTTTFLEAVCRTNGIEYTADPLTKIDSLSAYFDLVHVSGNYTIVLSCRDTCSKYWKEFAAAAKIKAAAAPVFRGSFVWAMDGNRLLCDEASTEMIVKHCVSVGDAAIEARYDVEQGSYIIKNTAASTHIRILSQGYDVKDGSSRSEIMVNNVDYSMNRRGINVVVINNRTGKVADSFNVDTFADAKLKMIRK